MLPRSLPSYVTAALVGLALALLVILASPSAVASGHGDVPPVIPVDIRPDPPFQNVSAETEEMTFTIELGAIEEGYTGDFVVDLSVGGDHVATIEDIWPPNTRRMNVSTQEDADEGPGDWEPSVGVHGFNLSVEADGKTLPFDFPLPMGPDLAFRSSGSTRGSTQDTSIIVDTEPGLPLEGDEVSFQVNVSNQGSWDTPEGQAIPVTLTHDGEEIGRQTVQDIASLDKVPVTFEDVWTAEPGTHEFGFEIDPDAIEEIHEDNNANTFELTVPETGLTVKQLSAVPDPAASGEPVTVEAMVVNEDDEQAPESLTLLYLDGEVVAETTIDALEAGETTNLSWEIEPATGDHELVVVPDGEQRPSTPPRGPQTASTDLLVGTDLVLTGTETSPDRVIEGDNVTVTGTIENRGASTDEAIAVVLLDRGSQQTLAERTIEGLDAQASTEVSIQTQPSAGERAFAIAVDPNEQLEEISTDNNRGFLTLTVRKEIPELSIHNLGLAEENVLPGDVVAAQATITNDADATVANLSARFLLDGAPLGQALSLEPIEGAASTNTTSHEWAAQPGRYTLAIEVGSPSELEREDPLARAATLVTVADVEPRVVVTDIQATPDSASAGDEVVLSVNITNEGDAPARAFAVAFEIGGERIGMEHVGELAPGEAMILESPSWQSTGESTEAAAIIDPNGSLHGQQELDRNASVTIQADQGAPVPGVGLLGALASLGVASILCRASRS